VVKLRRQAGKPGKADQHLANVGDAQTLIIHPAFHYA